jgi:hypothetical protein
MLQFRPALKLDMDAAILLMGKIKNKNANIAVKDKELIKEIEVVIKAGRFSGDDGEQYPLNCKGKLVLLAGLGEEIKVNSTALRIAVRRALQSQFLS